MLAKKAYGRKPRLDNRSPMCHVYSVQRYVSTVYREGIANYSCSYQLHEAFMRDILTGPGVHHVPNIELSVCCLFLKVELPVLR